MERLKVELDARRRGANEELLLSSFIPPTVHANACGQSLLLWWSVWRRWSSSDAEEAPGKGSHRAERNAKLPASSTTSQLPIPIFILSNAIPHTPFSMG